MFVQYTGHDIVQRSCSISTNVYSAHQKSGNRVTETVQFYVVITYTSTFTFVSELNKTMP